MSERPPINTIVHGDTLSVLRTLPDNYIQCCVSSPPYFGLRSYLPDGHPDKHLEIGLEETPTEYIEKLVQVFREVRRVLKNNGVCWLNLGDCYAGSGKGGGGSYALDKMTYAEGLAVPLTSGFKSKDLMMIPARVAIALCADGWYLRQDCIWNKTNAMPESVTDRPTTAHEHIFLLAKNERYFYDADAIAEIALQKRGIPRATPQHKRAHLQSLKTSTLGTHQGYEQKNARSVWMVPTQAFSEAHFAVMPPKLVEPCILAGSRPGDIVLDPFMGSGTVAMVALQHNRNYLGIELNSDYIALAQKRIAVIQPNLWSANMESDGGAA